MKKTRYLDHIDLRVSNLKRAHKFYSQLLPALGFTCDRSGGRWGIFYATGGDKPESIFRLHAGSAASVKWHANRVLG